MSRAMTGPVTGELTRPVQTVPDVCPYCGGNSFSGARCLQCRGLVDPLSLQASQNDMGPWFIRNPAAPFRPGCSYRLMVQQILKGRVDRDTIVRGPTTRQFWRKAEQAPGIAHLLGICHSCGTTVVPDSDHCGNCHASFVIDTSRQHLGLGPVFLVPGQTTGEEVVVAGKKLPPLVDDSVDFEPIHFDDPVPSTLLSNEEPTQQIELKKPASSRAAAAFLIVWATLATMGLGILVADAWLNLDLGILPRQASK
jgi:hypothetical protein